MLRTIHTLIARLLILAVLCFAAAVQAQEGKSGEDIACKLCNSVNPPGSTFCGQCGARLQIEPAPVPAHRDTLAPTAAAPDIIPETAQVVSPEAKVLFELAGQYLALGRYSQAGQYYAQVAAKFPHSTYAPMSRTLVAECERLAYLAQKQHAGSKKKGGGSAFGGALLGALLTPLILLAVISAAG